MGSAPAAGSSISTALRILMLCLSQWAGGFMRLASTQLRKFTNPGGRNAKAPVNTGAFMLVNSSQNVHESRLWALPLRAMCCSVCLSKVEQIEAELRGLSPADVKRVRDWLDDFVEDRLELGKTLKRPSRNRSGKWLQACVRGFGSPDGRGDRGSPRPARFSVSAVELRRRSVVRGLVVQ